MAPNRIAYLLCEVKGRDLDSRMLIAAHLLKAGVPVVVGQQWAILSNGKTALPGCILFNTVNWIQGIAMPDFRAAGYLLVGSDAEGLPFANDGFLVNIDPPSMGQLDLFLTQGDLQTRIMRERFPDLAVKTSGSPRVDLLRATKTPRPMAERYILFNTNFALTNSVWGDLNEVVRRLVAGGGIDPNTEEGKAELQTRLDFEVATRNDLIPLINWCAANLRVPVVVRPHPTENAATWKKIESPSLRVVTNSSPMPWIANAKLMVHANSTTGLEAAVLGTPCLNLSPPQYEQWVGQFLMRKVNHTVATLAEATREIDMFVKTGRGIRGNIHAAGFAPHGGERTAAAMVDLLQAKGAVPVQQALNWRQEPREDVARAKFSATREEFAASLTAASRGLKLPQVHIKELDDSLVLLVPEGGG